MVEQVPADRIDAGVGGAEGTAFECRVQITVMGWSEELECLGIEDRQDISVGFDDDAFNTIDLVRCMGGWCGESRHVGRQSYAHVFFSGRGGYPDGAFEESGKLLEVGLAWIVGIE